MGRIPIVAVTLAAALAIGCSAMRGSARAAQSGSEQTNVVTIRGTLDQVFAIGGETTGWIVKFDREQRLGGETRRDIEVDPRPAGADLGPLTGKRIEATGTLTKVQGVERGERTVLVIERIHEAK